MITSNPIPFVRKTIDLLDQKMIARNSGLASTKSKGQQALLAAGLLQKNDELIAEVEEARSNRNFLPLAQDPEFIKHKEQMIEFDQAGKYLEVLKMGMIENVLLIHEVNVHRKALGKTLLPVFRS